jgi:periplasmic divalent cation tolerance protein
VASDSSCCQVTTTFPDETGARQAAATAVGERLAACAQVAGPIQSTYRWAGKIESATEWYVHFKTTTARAPDLRSRLSEIHPYDTPEIIVLPIAGGDPAYLRWIEASVAPGT